jgi:MFS family permease
MSAALYHREFRLFLGGSFLSNTGTWMQSVAQGWLVLELSNSAFYLGLDHFANMIPISIFAFWGGVIADRWNRRKTLFVTQWIMMALAIGLGLLVQFEWVRVWHVILFSFMTGLSQAIAWPVYQTVMSDVVAKKDLPNAIALNAAQFNLARTIGPVVGAYGLRWFGTAGCFYANAASFLGVILAISALPRQKETAVSREDPKASGSPCSMDFATCARNAPCFGFC